MTKNLELHAGRLRRLAPEFYRGRAYVHWSMGMEDRATGWLSAMHHARMREVLCHVLGRYRLVCPAYCFMPDHAHFLWVGWDEQSDQRGAAALFRRAWNSELYACDRWLQRQAYDHVLREHERERDAFSAVAQYIRDNPVRKGLVKEARAYPFSGALVPGYPELDLEDIDFWPRFWRIYGSMAEKGIGEA